MLIVSLTVSPWAANCYLVGPDDSSECLVIDPGIGGCEAIIRELNRLGRQPKAVVGTHGHLDHVGDGAQLADQFGIPVLLSVDDQPMLTHPLKGLGLGAAPILHQLLGAETLCAPSEVIDLVDGQPVTLAGVTFTPRSAPGHTRGSMLLDFDSEVFTGDVVFAGAIGRMDLPGGSVEQMKRTLDTVIPALNQDARLYPGHGASTTLARELATNPYLQPDMWK